MTILSVPAWAWIALGAAGAAAFVGFVLLLLAANGTTDEEWEQFDRDASREDRARAARRDWYRRTR